MILGKLNDDLDAVIPLEVSGLERVQVEAVIDTGFTEFLTLPLAMIQRLGFEFASSETTTLADGSTIEMDDYRGTVIWDGEQREVIVTCSESDPLVGMAMLEGFELRMRVLQGGTVMIEKITAVAG
jgi:clan AA aspartic protease